MSLKYVNGISGAPEAIGPYSPAVDTGELIFISGQVPIDPATKKLVEGGIEAQTEQVMKNLKAVLSHCKLDFQDVVRAGIFVTDLSHFQTINTIYGDWLGEAKPARATVQVSALPLGALVEIEMIAKKR